MIANSITIIWLSRKNEEGDNMMGKKKNKSKKKNPIMDAGKQQSSKARKITAHIKKSWSESLLELRDGNYD